MLHWVLIIAATAAGAAPPAEWLTSKQLRAAEYVRKLGGARVSFPRSPDGRLESRLVFHQSFSGLPAAALPSLLALPPLREVIDERKLELEADPDHRSIDRDLALLASCPTIERVEVRNPELTQAGLVQLQRYKRLRSLCLAGSGRTDADLPLIGRLSGLRSLDLFDNPLTGESFVHLRGLVNLNRLVLKCVEIQMGELSFCRNLPLTELDISGSRVTDATVHVIACFPRLRKLSIAGTRLSDSACTTLRRLRYLEWIDVTVTNIRDDGIECIASLPRISTIICGQKELSDRVAHSLARCRTLTSLSIPQVPFSRAGLRALTASRSLQYLNAAFTNMGDAELRALARMPSLRTIRVDWCDGVTEAQVKEIRSFRRKFRILGFEFHPPDPED